MIEFNSYACYGHFHEAQIGFFGAPKTFYVYPAITENYFGSHYILMLKLIIMLIKIFEADSKRQEQSKQYIFWRVNAPDLT